MYSLEFLDVKDNAIMQAPDVFAIGNLPCLERLELKGNPIESSVEYRTRVLEAFGDRAGEVRRLIPCAQRHYSSGQGNSQWCSQRGGGGG